MLSKKSLLILSHLRKNARQSVVSISRKTKIPISTVYDRIKSFEKNIVKKHTSLIDFSKIGFNIRLNILVKVIKKENFKKFLLENIYVNSAYTIEGLYNFVIDCVFRDMIELQMFLDKIESFDVEQKTFHYVIDELKRESFLENPKLLHLLKW